MEEKRKFLLDFHDYYFDHNGGKCYFKLTSGQICQGWITEVYDETFEYLDSGPLAREEPYLFAIRDIDTNSFAYWDEHSHTWMEYPNR